MAVNIPNLDQITHDSPKLGEALKKVESYINNNVNAVIGNRRSAPPKGLVNPSKKP